nr:helix-turn-helix domain-containing protein [Mycobacterium bourgelatii]
MIDGSPVSEVAERYGVCRQTVSAWRKRYEADGLDGLADQSRRPHSSPGRISAEVEALICETRRNHRRWGARRIAHELRNEISGQAPSRSTVHRAAQRFSEYPRAATQTHLQTVGPGSTDAAVATRYRRRGVPSRWA